MNPLILFLCFIAFITAVAAALIYVGKRKDARETALRSRSANPLDCGPSSPLDGVSRDRYRFRRDRQEGEE